jgi:hypothetical protein
MTRQGRLGDRSHSRQHRTYSDRGRAGDWTNDVVVALVLSIAVLVATIAIAVYDNSALLASRRLSRRRLGMPVGHRRPTGLRGNIRSGYRAAPPELP